MWIESITGCLNVPKTVNFNAVICYLQNLAQYMCVLILHLYIFNIFATCQAQTWRADRLIANIIKPTSMKNAFV